MGGGVSHNMESSSTNGLLCTVIRPCKIKAEYCIVRVIAINHQTKITVVINRPSPSSVKSDQHHKSINHKLQRRQFYLGQAKSGKSCKHTLCSCRRLPMMLRDSPRSFRWAAMSIGSMPKPCTKQRMKHNISDI